MWRCFCVLALLCAFTQTRADVEKRAEMSPVPFVLGSRYGRSPQLTLMPRNDRFFMGSRYGKRSEGAMPVGSTVICEYAGFHSLYRCVRPAGHTLFDNRRTNDDVTAGVSDEE